jgi:hypothetical protein
MRALLWTLFDRSAGVQPATVVAETTIEGAALASVRSVGVGTARHCGVGHDGRGRYSGLCSIGRRGLSQPLWWRTRQVRALLWPLFARSAWSQLATVVSDTKGEDAALASVRLSGVGSTSHCSGVHDR